MLKFLGSNESSSFILSNSIFENKLSENVLFDCLTAGSSTSTLSDEENCADDNNCNNIDNKLKIDILKMKTNSVLKKHNAYSDTFIKNSSKISGDLIGERNPGNNFSNEFRRNRTSFSDKQLKILQETFNVSMYPDEYQRKVLMNRTSLNEDKIITWFSNRRARWRKLLNNGMVPSNTECFKLNPSNLSSLVNNSKNKNVSYAISPISTLNSTQKIPSTFTNTIHQIQNGEITQHKPNQLIYNQQLLSQILPVNSTAPHTCPLLNAGQQTFSTDANLTSVNTFNSTQALTTGIVPLILAQEQQRQNEQMMFFINQLKYQATITAIAAATNTNMANEKID